MPGAAGMLALVSERLKIANPLDDLPFFFFLSLVLVVPAGVQSVDPLDLGSG